MGHPLVLPKLNNEIHCFELIDTVFSRSSPGLIYLNSRLRERDRKTISVIDSIILKKLNL